MKLMETSLRLAHALTRINNGELGAPSDLVQDELPTYHTMAEPELNDEFWVSESGISLNTLI